jgi:O-antigen/teichoic acid export membrane protein
MGFATWTTYGMGAVICRQQGLAILVNKFFGTVYNASYGIANQIYGALSFIVTSIVNAMNPQIMKAEGQHERKQMFHLAEQESKFIVSVMALIFIPLIFEMDNVLHVWLGDVPVCAVFFSQCIFITFLIDQVTYGLHSAAQAIGQIRNYTLLMYTPKLLSLAVFWISLKTNGSIEQVMYWYIGIEALVAIMRLPYLHKTAGLNVKVFLYKVPLRLLPLITILIVLSYIQQYTWDSTYRFFFTIPIIVLIGAITAWFSTFTPSERNALIHFVKK